MTLLERNAFRTRWKYAAAISLDSLGPALRGLAKLRAVDPPTPPSSWRRGVILGDAHIGDVLYRTASLPHLARAVPECEWTYLASRSSAEVLAGNPYVATVAEQPDEQGAWLARHTQYKVLRDGNFDVALCTNAVGYAPDLIAATAAGIPNRVALTHKGLSVLVTQPIRADFPRPVPAYIRSMVAAIGELAEDWPLRPVLYPGSSDVAAAREAAARLDLDARPVIACAPVTREPLGAWPVGIFAAMAKLLARTHNVVLCGARTDKSALLQLAERGGIAARILAGDLNIRSLAVFFGGCKAVLAQDSGPRHIANAAGTPVGFFRILAVHPVEAGRYCDSEVDLAPPASGPLDAEAARVVVASTSPANALSQFLEFADLHAGRRHERAEIKQWAQA